MIKRIISITTIIIIIITVKSISKLTTLLNYFDSEKLKDVRKI
jgi:hypothetical protein